jgi:plasmid maintenance system antidote protein VapI
MWSKIKRMEESMYKVGKCLLGDLLKRKRMSQKELAEQLGVSKQQINKYIKNHSKMHYQTALRISKILNCKMEDLYEIKIDK